MQIRVAHGDISISPDLIRIIQHSIAQYEGEIDTGFCILFKDPGYSAETGGFHPVEIGLNPTGKLLYITDFAYVGRQPYAELVKELDFDFQHRVVQQAGRDYSISNGVSLYKLWESNFLAYYAMDVYVVTVTTL